MDFDLEYYWWMNFSTKFSDVTQISQSKVQLQQQGPPKVAPQILKAPSPVRDVVPGNTTK